jgi:hypothetical protein
VKALSHIVLVLWGQGFDEVAASIFVAELRRLGERVQLVGLNRQQLAGHHGLTLVPDLPLGQALSVASRIQSIIVPAPLATLQQFSYDPRLAELLGRAMDNHALLVLNAMPSQEHSRVLFQPASHSPPLPKLTSGPNATPSPAPDLSLNLLVYPATDELITFVQFELAPRLNSDRQSR